MKLMFSESKPDYGNYIFPYVVWAFPEDDETPGYIFDKGFLPSTPDLKRFYLCRHVRVSLPGFELSSENRRIMRKGESLSFKLLKKDEFDFNDHWRKFCGEYSNIKFGDNVMSCERLDRIFHSPVTTHIMVFKDNETGNEEGLVFLYLEKNEIVYYYYSFYNLNHPNRNLGMYMMTQAVEFFHEEGFHHIYLGTCYFRNYLYKTQFKGFEFFNGFKWSNDIKELKHLIKRNDEPFKEHLLENREYLLQFHDEDINTLKDRSFFVLSQSP